MTGIDWAERMNAAVDYIEENLAGEIDMGIAASAACCSEYHFARFFSYIADLPLSEYIRQRRLTLAGFMIQKSNSNLIDIAALFGYSSPNSFSRAFQAVNGISPSEARNPGMRLKAAERIRFAAPEKAENTMSFQIVDEVGYTVFGVSTIVGKSDAYLAVPAFLNKCELEKITNNIVKAGKGNERTLLKSMMWDKDDGMMNYMLCLDMPLGGVPSTFETMAVPARTWAVFPLVLEKPSDSIITVWKRIWTKWFPNSGYEQDTGPRQERCHWGENGKMVAEAWVPVIKSAHS